MQPRLSYINVHINEATGRQDENCVFVWRCAETWACLFVQNRLENNRKLVFPSLHSLFSSLAQPSAFYFAPTLSMMLLQRRNRKTNSWRSQIRSLNPALHFNTVARRDVSSSFTRLLLLSFCLLCPSPCLFIF